MKLNDLERILSVPRCVEVPRRWDYYEKKLTIKEKIEVAEKAKKVPDKKKK